jgi:hypothetical protein
MNMAPLSRTNRNFVIAYVVLVGLPLLGLVGVLKAGHGLRAPTSVDGLWTLEASAALCGQRLQNSTMNISQSGQSLVVSLDNGLNITGSGTLSVTAIDAAFSIPATAVDRCGGATLLLNAAIDPKEEPKTMHGTISVKDCASCSQVTYRAARQTHSMKKEAH